MDIIIESVKKLESLLEQSGCADGGVQIDVSPDCVNCRFETGACMTADFGKKQGIYATFDPIRCYTRISFMFGAPLGNPQVRGAACAIINVTTGFFCLSRTLRPCPAASHATCGRELAEVLAGKQVCIIGTVHSSESLKGVHVTEDPAAADTILIGADGIIGPGAGDIIADHKTSRRIICIGPSTIGVARLNELEHWCPYGQS